METCVEKSTLVSWWDIEIVLLVGCGKPGTCIEVIRVGEPDYKEPVAMCSLIVAS